MFQRNGNGFEVLDEFRRRFHLTQVEYQEIANAWKPFHEAYSKPTFYLDGTTNEQHAYAFLFLLAQDEQRISVAYANHHQVSGEDAVRALSAFRGQFARLLLTKTDPIQVIR